jgi:5-oxoprolinase (ATP-hydrolysing)
VVRANGRTEHFGATASVQMEAGDLFVIETPGGGGFGNPPPARDLVVEIAPPDERPMSD